MPTSQSDVITELMQVLSLHRPQTLQRVLELLRFQEEDPSKAPASSPADAPHLRAPALLKTPAALSPVDGGSAFATPPPCSPVPAIAVTDVSEEGESRHLVEPQPRDLDVTDPDSIETSLTAINRSIDYGYELAQIMRCSGSFNSMCVGDDGPTSPSGADRGREDRANGFAQNSVSPLVSPHSRSLAIFHRRLAFRAKKEEFYPETDRDPLVIVTVGLPARGKSYVARRLCRYMGWKGVPCRIFNAGNYRRTHLGADQASDFFDPSNASGAEARERMVQLAAEDLIDYIRQGGQIGILDATNTTRMRRRHVREIFENELGLPRNRIIFLEMICNDMKMVTHNILEVKLKGKDYEDVDPEAALADFKRREAEYMKVYETLELNHPEDKTLSFVQLVDAGESLVTHRIVGSLPKSLVQFASFLKPFAGHLYVTVNGETPEMIAGKLGVNSGLAPSGIDFSKRLENWANRLGYENMHVWCAPTNAGMQTAQPFLYKKKKYHVQVWRALMDIDYGKFQGYSYAEVRDHYPHVWSALQKDEYFYTWPGGESACGVVQRLDPILMAMEGKTAPILILCSRTVCRAILSYCCDLIPEQFTRITLPKNTVFDIDMNAEPVRVNMIHI